MNSASSCLVRGSGSDSLIGECTLAVEWPTELEGALPTRDPGLSEICARALEFLRMISEMDGATIFSFSSPD